MAVMLQGVGYTYMKFLLVSSVSTYFSTVANIIIDLLLLHKKKILISFYVTREQIISIIKTVYGFFKIITKFLILFCEAII